MAGLPLRRSFPQLSGSQQLQIGSQSGQKPDRVWASGGAETEAKASQSTKLHLWPWIWASHAACGVAEPQSALRSWGGGKE